MNLAEFLDPIHNAPVDQMHQGDQVVLLPAWNLLT